MLLASTLLKQIYLQNCQAFVNTPTSQNDPTQIWCSFLFPTTSQKTRGKKKKEKTKKQRQIMRPISHKNMSLTYTVLEFKNMALFLPCILLLKLFVTTYSHDFTQPNVFGSHRFLRKTSTLSSSAGKQNQTQYYNKGEGELAAENSGVSAMHMFMFPNTNKVVMFDRAAFGPSQIRLAPGDCPHVIHSRNADEVDC